MMTRNSFTSVTSARKRLLGFGKALGACKNEALAYSRCVSDKENIVKNSCEKEFLAFKACADKVSACASNLCKTSATCIPNYSEASYRCACAPMFNGTYCEVYVADQAKRRACQTAASLCGVQMILNCSGFCSTIFQCQLQLQRVKLAGDTHKNYKRACNV